MFKVVKIVYHVLEETPGQKLLQKGYELVQDNLTWQQAKDLRKGHKDYEITKM